MQKWLLVRAHLLALMILSSTLWAADSAQSAWAEFRQQFSYHVQTVGLVDGHYLIISEPPPHVTVEGLTSLAPSVLNHPLVFKHAMGVDGWVKDIVFELPQMESGSLSDLLDSIHLYIFGTTYKANVLQLRQSTFGGIQSRPARLDLQVTAADIYRWTLVENEQFSKVGRTKGVSPSSILNSGDTGVYYSRTPGLVLWVLPRDLDMTKRHREGRQFAVDSDLILGALYSSSRVAIVARERVLSPSLFPPLRFETIELLASVRRRALAQSYERGYILAGRMDGERHDWAPIYLSPELIDTEYGSLLNITDQLLKSWTEAGRVRYADFNYPDPSDFPFGQAGLVDPRGSLTYNWNTTGVGYKVTFGLNSVFALNRTGALAVSYIAHDSQRLSTKEDLAYTYFAQLNNPDLARVVQYAALYQIFRDMKSDASSTVPSDPANPARKAMAELVLGALRTLRDVDFSNRVDLNAPGGAQLLRDLTTCRSKVTSISSVHGDSGMEDFAEQLAAFRNENGPSFPLLRSLRDSALGSANTDAALKACKEVVGPAGGRQMRARAFEAYRKAWVRPDSGWIHTASVVLSHWTASGTEYLSLVGGHNLYSEITKLREDPSLPAGKISVLTHNNEVVIVHSKFDRAKAHELVRVAARERERPLATTLSLRTALEEQLARTHPSLRTQIQALDYPQAPSVPRSFQRSLYPSESITQGAVQDVVQSGTQFSSQAVPASLREVTATPGHVVILKKPSGTYQLVFGGLENPVEVKSMPALVDQMLDPTNLSSSPSQMQIHLAGFTPEEGDGFLKNIEFQMRRQANDTSVLTGIVQKDGNVTPEVVRELNTHYDFSQARLSAPRLTVIEDGPLQGGHLFEAQLEIPARLAVRPSIWMKIRIFFSEKLPETLSSAIQRSLDSVLARLGNERAALKVQARNLKREILRICPDARRVELELNNFSITERLETPGNGELLPKSA